MVQWGYVKPQPAVSKIREIINRVYSIITYLIKICKWRFSSFKQINMYAPKSVHNKVGVFQKKSCNRKAFKYNSHKALTNLTSTGIISALQYLGLRTLENMRDSCYNKIYNCTNWNPQQVSRRIIS